MSGTLFVVATPIGNLEDVTLRALRVLQTVDLIAAEDTRRTARFLAHHGLSTPTLSFHQHNTRSRTRQLIARLQRGDSIAVVTDAGTPGVSDPGVELVEAAIASGIPVDPVPGANAPLTAAIASGFRLIPLTIFGFAPARSKDRAIWLEHIGTVPHTLTFFDSPHRIARTLTEAAAVLGTRQIVVGRELTKVHQEFVRGTAKDLAGRFEHARGEFTVVVGPRDVIDIATSVPDDRTIVDEFCYSTEVLCNSRRVAINSVAKKYKIPSKVVYRIVEQTKNMLNNQ